MSNLGGYEKRGMYLGMNLINDMFIYQWQS